jgi:hypothetical protein
MLLPSRLRAFLQLSLGAAVLLGASLLRVTAAGALPATHPRLVLSSNEIEALKQTVHDGGDDDAAYAAIQARWPRYRDAPVDSLVDATAAFNVFTELGLLAHLEFEGEPARQRLLQLTLYIAQTRPVDDDDYRSSLRLRCLALGYDLAFDYSNEPAFAVIRSAILSYLQAMPANFNYYRYAYNPFVSNRGMMVGSSAGLAAIAVWDDLAPADQAIAVASLNFAAALIGKCLSDAVASDGCAREGVLYGAWTLRMLIPYIEARRRFDGYDLGLDHRLEHVADWLAYELLPEGGGHTNNLNDSPWFSRPLAIHSTYLDWAQARYQSGLARWLYRHVGGDLGGASGEDTDRAATVLWNRSLPSVDPGVLLPASQLFASRGLYCYRSAWMQGAQGNEVLFTLQAGRFFGGHAQEDQGQFTLYACGDRFALDNGAAYPSNQPKESESHNLVLMDGLGEHNAGRSIGTDAHFASVLQSPFGDYLRAALDSAYATYSPFNRPNQPFPGTDWSWGYDGGNPLQRAERLVTVVKGPETPPWFLIADALRKDSSSHAWDWLLHTDAKNQVELADSMATIHGIHSRLEVRFAAPRPPSLELSVAPYDNGGEDPSTLRLRAHVQAVKPDYAVALLPIPDSLASPSVTTWRSGSMTCLRLQWRGVEDLAAVNGSDSLVASQIETDAQMAVVRYAGDTIRYLMGDGTILRCKDVTLLVLGGRASAAVSGTTLHVSSDVTFAAYAPDVESVLGPAGPLPFERSGPVVHSPTPTGVESAANVASATWIGGRRSPVRFHATAAHVADRIAIYDVRGRLVRKLGMPADTSPSVAWDAKDERGMRVAPGVYLARRMSGAALAPRRIVLLP